MLRDVTVEEAEQIVHAYATKSDEQFSEWLLDKFAHNPIGDGLLIPIEDIPVNIFLGQYGVDVPTFGANVRFHRDVTAQRRALEAVEQLAGVFSEACGLDTGAYRDCLTGYTVEADDIQYNMKYVPGDGLEENKQF